MLVKYCEYKNIKHLHKEHESIKHFIKLVKCLTINETKTTKYSVTYSMVTREPYYIDKLNSNAWQTSKLLY